MSTTSDQNETLTSRLAGFARSTLAVSPETDNEARRTLLNYIGCVIGGSAHETVRCALDAIAPFAGRGSATLLGRPERLDVLNATLINGIASNVFGFDDTHLDTVIHPAGPVASAILALCEHIPVSGRDLLDALIVGVDIECRLGRALSPAHVEAVSS